MSIENVHTCPPLVWQDGLPDQTGDYWFRYDTNPESGFIEYVEFFNDILCTISDGIATPISERGFVGFAGPIPKPNSTTATTP